MKRTIAFLIVLCMVICLFAGCGTKSAAPTAAPETEATAEPLELIVFAAASMTETLNQLWQTTPRCLSSSTLTPPAL